MIQTREQAPSLQSRANGILPEVVHLVHDIVAVFSLFILVGFDTYQRHGTTKLGFQEQEKVKSGY